MLRLFSYRTPKNPKPTLPMKKSLSTLCSFTYLAAFLILPISAKAQLTWGASGTGGTGTWNDVNVNWYDGTDVVWDSTSATFAGTAGTVTVSGTQNATGLAFGPAGYTVTGGEIALTGGAPTIDVTTNGLSTINSVLSGANGLTIDGGNTSRYLVVGGNNSGLSGAIAVTNGILRVGHANALGTSDTLANGLTMGAGTVLQLQGGITLDKHITGSAGGALTITAYTGNSTLTGVFIPNNQTLFQLDSGQTLTLSGDAGLGRTGSTLQTVGTGSLIVDAAGAGASAFGIFIRDSSTLQVNAVSNPFGTGGSNIFIGDVGSTPTLALNGATITNNMFLTATTAERRLSNISASNSTFGGQVFMAGDITLASRVADSKLVVSGNIRDTGDVEIGSAGFANLGTVEFTRATGNAYVGNTSINSGTLLVNNASGSGTGTGAVTVEDGATLGGAGFITGAVTVNSGGTLAPGNSPGIISTGDLSLMSGSFLSVEIDSITVGTGYDQVDVTGSVTLGGDLQIALGFTPAPLDNFFLINNDGADAITGLLGGHAQGDQFSLGGYIWKISYVGDFGTNSFTGGNDLVIQGVPEPGTSVLLGLALGLGVFGMRRRSTQV
jgi:fibronectin-binding autotransporter adhesin